MAKTYTVERIESSHSNGSPARGIVHLRVRDEDAKIDEVLSATKESSDGQISALLDAVQEIIGWAPTLHVWHADAVTPNDHSEAGVSVILRNGDHDEGGYNWERDVVQATVRAYVEAVNKLERHRSKATH